MKRERITRAAPLVGLSARTALGRVNAALRRRLGDDDALVEFHQRTAARYAERLGNARGALMKAGQLMSFVEPAGLIAPEYWDVYQEALGSLRADAEPMSGDVAMAVVEAELGAPIDTVFASFEAEPLAAASIGQVHRADRADGGTVAVKVQYPFAADAISADLANTELLATFFKLAQGFAPGMPRLDARAVAAEVRARITEELDYRLEADNQETFARIYEGDPAIRIPRVHRDLSTRRVLAMDLATGAGWDAALQADQHLRDSWGATINRFFFRAIYRHGLFHADPHPGNYLFHDDGTVSFLDFGCVKRFDDATLAGFVAIACSTVNGDIDGLADAFRSQGFLEDDAISAREVFDYYAPTFEPLTASQPYRFTPEFVTRTLLDLNPGGPQGQISRRFRLPPHHVLATRIYIGLYSVLAALRATSDWRAEFEACLAAYDERLAGRPRE